MSSLNFIMRETLPTTVKPENLIELPNPKILKDECTVILNGHHNYALNDSVREDTEGTEPFLNRGKISRSVSNSKSDSIMSPNSVASTMVSSGASPLKETSIPSSPEDDSDNEVEPESSTHLLQRVEHQIQSPKSMKTKNKLPNFRLSPSKKTSSTDAHSHIQHRPLGLSQNTVPPHPLKWNWSVTRFACLGFMISVFLGVTFIVVGLYLSSPNTCATKRQWWQGTTIYEIFPASFQDTDSDGFGDIRGIIERLDYIQNLSIEVIRLNSIFSALDYPLEYEHVIDFANIDPHLGNSEDLEELVKDVHSRGMYVILDINPTVTSDQHTWAAHWLLHRPGQYENFYVNISDDEDDPPMEASSDYEDRTWTPPHRTFGSHLFLNWSNPLLQLEMRSVFELWLSLGVDGFYVKHLEDITVTNQAHIAALIHQWRYVLDKYSVNSTRKILIMSHDTLQELGSVIDPITYLSLPSLIDVVDTRLNVMTNESILNVGKEIDSYRKFWDQFPVSPMIMWHVGSVETLRLAGRLNDDCNIAALLLLSILPGSVSTFYGDEIGLRDAVDTATLKVYRGGQLAPMQWTPGLQSNFTTNITAPWIPIHPNYQTENVEKESEKLMTFQKVVEIKKREGPFYPAFFIDQSLMHSFVSRISGIPREEQSSYQWYNNKCGLMAARTSRGDVDYVFIANFGTEPQVLAEDICVGEGDFIWSVHQLDIIFTTNKGLNGKVELDSFFLEPGDAIVGLLIT